MKLGILTVAILGTLAVGCEPAQEVPEMGHADAWLIRTVDDTAIRNAIIRQRTVFPYHFTPGTANLTELGIHDMSVLAGYYSQNAGKLSVRRGNASERLYKARVDSVVAALRRAGVARKRVEISDSPPAGDGMPSEHVLIILRKEAEAAGAQRPLPVIPVQGVR
ncbi:MAG: hypothetical protein ACYTF6_04080 [Planctomycetota bacterium]|jgi:hypothetical protein